MEEKKVKEPFEDLLPVPRASGEVASYRGVVSMPRLPQRLIYPNQIASIGVTVSDAQRINYQWYMNHLELEKRREEKAIELQFLAAKQNLLENNQSQTVGNYDISVSGESAFINIKDIVKKFIEEKLLVRLRGQQFKNGRGFFIRNEELNKHELIEDKELKHLFDEYILENFDVETDIPQKDFDRGFIDLKKSIPALQISNLIRVSDSQLVFFDGIYNVNSGEFKFFNGTKIFNDVSISMNWNQTGEEVPVFDALLADIFDGDESKINLAYEFIGAMLSTVPTLKKIFILQGVSQAGKSRLARIICALFDEGEVVFLDKLSDINQEYVQKNLSNFRLIYIDEASDKKILPAQASALKVIANGCRRVKILIGTNHALYTGDNCFVEPALLNRFAVLPFEKPMENTDPNVSAFEDVFFEAEKNSIIKKSLLRFRNMLARGFFCKEFHVNEVITVEKTIDEKDEQLRNFLFGNYEITSAIMPETTADSIAAQVNRVLRGVVKNNASLGKKLSEIYGDKLQSQHLSRGMAYNLRKVTK